MLYLGLCLGLEASTDILALLFLSFNYIYISATNILVSIFGLRVFLYDILKKLALTISYMILVDVILLYCVCFVIICIIGIAVKSAYWNFFYVFFIGQNQSMFLMEKL